MNGLEIYTQALDYLLPEIFVIIAIVATTLWNLFFPKLKELTPVWAILGLGSAFCCLLAQFFKPQIALFSGLMTIDQLTLTIGLITTFVGILIVLMTMGYEHHL